MTHSNPRRAIVVATFVGLTAALVGASPANAATTPEIRALQRQVKILRTQVASLRSELNTLKATVGEVSSNADAASTAATTAGQNASAAVSKTNCLVNATAFVVWNNDVYAIDSSNLGVGTGMDISAAGDPVTGYVAGINASCVPSVFPRFPGSSFSAVHTVFSLGAMSDHR